MSRWFRLYDDLVDDPKIQRLPGDIVKALLNLWCLASQNDGLLPAHDDIAFKLRMKPAKVEHLLSVLGECGLIDSDETGLRPHNWDKRQFKSDVSNERVKQHRERKRNVTSTVTVTPPETEQKQKTETEADIAASPRHRKKPIRSLPDDFQANATTAGYAKGLGFSDFEIKREHQKFCMHARSKGLAYADWHAAEHNWFTKAAEFAGKRPRGEEDIADDGLIEVLDQTQLEAWDAYTKTSTGKPLPRNKKGGWRLPSKWPPGYENKMMADVEKLIRKEGAA